MSSKTAVHGMSYHGKFRTTIKFLLAFALILIPIISLCLSSYFSSKFLISKSKISIKNQCNLFRGKWIPSPAGPYYTNETCKEIIDLDEMNCMKHGRPDREFLKWRWKPNDCELPLFNALEFLELVRGKSMVFVGDSLARNHAQSLLCLLKAVATPVSSSSSEYPKNEYWFYSDYNVTIAHFWSPFLVKVPNNVANMPHFYRPMNIYLDRANEAWASCIETFDYVIFSVASWFYRPQMYFEHDQVVACSNCSDTKLKKLTIFSGYRRALRTAFKTLVGLKNFKGVTFLRTLSPFHYENGKWDQGGICPKTRPIRDREEKHLYWGDQELYSIQKEEFHRAEKQGKKRGLRFKLIDTTDAMLARQDGHPNHYWPKKNATNADCIHWCLPGPVDSWSEFLLQMLKD